ncbi:hypothetical protein F4777DRAFT_521167 [Nemania sp. FL0916]|nr:hypothetical protein F4777DRAFT_521167 [Nemania sp. FL0916]
MESVDTQTRGQALDCLAHHWYHGPLRAYLTFDVSFPLLLHSNESPLPCRETARELAAASAHFSAQIGALFDVLKELQGPLKQTTRILKDGRVHEEGLELTIRIQRQSFDRYLDCYHRTYHSRHVVLYNSASLPSLSSVVKLRIESVPNYGAEVHFASVRSISPRVPLDILAHLPCIREIDCPWLWERPPIAFQALPMRHYTRPWEGPWRDSRHAFARAAHQLDGYLPSSLVKARLWFWKPSTFNDDQSVQMPNLIHPALADPISVGIRAIAPGLEELNVRAFLTPDLFDAETPWLRMKRLRVEFHPLRPDGSWYFVGPRGENPNPEGFEIQHEHYPPAICSPEDEEMDDLWIENEEGYEEDTRLPDAFRTEPLSDNIEPLLLAFATALTKMPSLKEAELFAYVEWNPSESRKAEYADDMPYEEYSIHRWGVKYISAAGDSKALVEWQVGTWRPQENIVKLFEALSGDDEVIVLWKPFDFLRSRDPGDISADKYSW